jgi:hypothetical protein
MSEHYDRQGNAMTLMEWAKSFETDKRRVAETTLLNGRLVSTVWMGLNHQFGNGPPLIFETMVFGSKEDMRDLDCDRYSTEAEAIAGHARMVEKWSVDQPAED